MGVMKRSGARRWILGALGLMLFALLAAYLMFFGVIGSSLLLNMLAVFCSLLGMIIGMYGTFLIVQSNRRSKDDPMNRGR